MLTLKERGKKKKVEKQKDRKVEKAGIDPAARGTIAFKLVMKPILLTGQVVWATNIYTVGLARRCSGRMETQFLHFPLFLFYTFFSFSSFCQHNLENHSCSKVYILHMQIFSEMVHTRVKRIHQNPDRSGFGEVLGRIFQDSWIRGSGHFVKTYEGLIGQMIWTWWYWGSTFTTFVAMVFAGWCT